MDQNLEWWHSFNGYFGPLQAMDLAQSLLEDGGRPSRAGLDRAAGLLRQALAFSPFDPDLLSLVCRLGRLTPFSSGFKIWLEATIAALRDIAPSPRMEVERVLKRLGSEPARLAALVRNHRDPHLQLQALKTLWRLGVWEHYRDCAADFLSKNAAGPSGPFLAWGFAGAGDWTTALDVCDRFPKNFLSLNLIAEAAWNAGDRTGALSLWRQSLAFEPDQPHLSGRIWEASQPLPASGLLDRHRVHVAFYTYNKLDMTLDTLSSLLESEIGGSPISLLNNGSTSFSPEELNQGVARVAAGRPVEVIHLPVNIGAPAARNWLWQLPRSRKADCVAFLDDDVLLPRDWLLCYLQDMEEYSQACVVGPRGVNPDAMGTIQYVYRYFQQVGEQTIQFTPKAPMAFDLGQFTLRRPCLSVMGCCHLLHRERCRSLGVPEFDICFSPSQADDIEHDLQVWKAGGAVLYDGRVRVVHRQVTGKTVHRDRATLGHVLANHMKMEHKFTAGDLEGIRSRVLEAEATFRQTCRLQA